MDDYKCQVKTGVIFRRVCSRPKAFSCSSCSIPICYEHAQNKMESGHEMCPKCFLEQDPHNEERIREESESWVYYDRTRYRYGHHDHDSDFDDSDFTDDDYAVFDQINEDGTLELNESYDS